MPACREEHTVATGGNTATEEEIIKWHNIDALIADIFGREPFQIVTPKTEWRNIEAAL